MLSILFIWSEKSLETLSVPFQSGFFSYRSVLQGLASIYATEGYRGKLSFFIKQPIHCAMQ